MASAVRDVMTKDVVTVDASTPIADAARRMRDDDIGNVLVTEGSSLRGILTDRDITVRAVAEGSDTQRQTVGEIISGDLVTLTPDEDQHDAAQKMRAHSVRRLPVVEGNRPVGIVSIGDLAVSLEPETALADISADTPNR
jgi:CBS domain-containing protein